MIREKTGIWSRFPLGLLIAIVAVQMAYWLVINPLLFVPKETPDKLAVSNVVVAKLATPDIAAMAKAQFKPAELPWDDCCEAGYRAVRMDFTLSTIPADGLAIVPMNGSDNYRMFINGSLLFGDGEMVLPNISYHGNVRATFRIPPAMLKTGTNQLDYILVRDAGTPYFSVATPAIGDFTTIKRAFSYRQYSLNSYLTMSQGIGFAAALLAFLLWLRSDRDPAIFWMALLCTAWAMRILHHRMTYPPVHGELRIILLYVWVNVVPVALLNFANHWTRHANRWVTRISVGSYGLSIAIVAVIVGFGLFGKIDTADRISMGFALAAAIATIGIFIAHYLKRTETRHWEVAVFGLCTALISADTLATLFDLHYGDHVKRALPVLLLGFIAPFFASNVRLFRSMSEFNTLLTNQLREREAEIAESYAARQALIRKQTVNEERQRIMRDMHDGLGSQLMSMLFSARRGKLEPQRVTEGLQSVIDEMRLMIDSMDSVGESLAIALATFHERIASRVEEAGLTLNWQDKSNSDFPDYGPRDVLQIFRVLQEAVNNALKHGHGQVITIVIQNCADDAFPVSISVGDDGIGMPEKPRKGRGLENMRARAAAIGASVNWVGGPAGVTVRLDLPAREPPAFPG